MSVLDRVVRSRQRGPARAGVLTCLGIGLGVSVWLGFDSSAFSPWSYPNSLACGHAPWCSNTVLRGTRCARSAQGGEAAEEFIVGDKVQAFSVLDGDWYPGTIQVEHDDGTYTVVWDDPDGGPESTEVGVDNLKKIIVFKDYVVGDDCEAESPDDNVWYPGSVSAINVDGTFTVKWDDPDGGPETADIEPDKMKKITVLKSYKVGDRVEAIFPEDGQFYPGVVSAVNSDGTFTVKWEDSDGGPEESPLTPKQMKLPPIPVDKLVVGAKYKGRVKKIVQFGAFVSFGAEVDGLVHLSRLSKERVTKVSDFLEVGQEVDVWVSDILDNGKVDLSMVEGITSRRFARVDLQSFQDYGTDEWIDGVVQSIAKTGAFVSVVAPNGLEAQGLVHARDIKKGVYWADVGSELKEGQKVRVRIKNVDLMKNVLSLTMLDQAKGGYSGRVPADLARFEDISPYQRLRGTVTGLQKFGAFVDVALEDGTSATGLVHITQIKDSYVKSVADELRVGQEVSVRILSVERDTNRLHLGIK